MDQKRAAGSVRHLDLMCSARLANRRVSPFSKIWQWLELKCPGCCQCNHARLKGKPRAFHCVQSNIHCLKSGPTKPFFVRWGCTPSLRASGKLQVRLLHCVRSGWNRVVSSKTARGMSQSKLRDGPRDGLPKGTFSGSSAKQPGSPPRKIAEPLDPCQKPSAWLAGGGGGREYRPVSCAEHTGSLASQHAQGCGHENARVVARRQAMQIHKTGIVPFV